MKGEEWGGEYGRGEAGEKQLPGALLKKKMSIHFPLTRLPTLSKYLSHLFSSSWIYSLFFFLLHFWVSWFTCHVRRVHQSILWENPLTSWFCLVGNLKSIIVVTFFKYMVFNMWNTASFIIPKTPCFTNLYINRGGLSVRWDDTIKHSGKRLRNKLTLFSSGCYWSAL